jgi:predicted nucleotidyltransferase
MAELALTEAERAFLAALSELGIRYLIVGLSAAVLQGADTVTADIDLWFEDRADARIHEAARRAGGVWVPGSFGMMPPTLGGDALGDRFDVVLTLDGLDDFASESARAKSIEVDGVLVRVLPLDRIIHTKRAAGRRKDVAVLPALEAALAAARDVEESNG